MMFMVVVSQAQSPTAEGNIDDEFKELIDASNDFQQYKVVKKTALETLRKKTDDHIQSLNAVIENKDALITSKDQQITALNSELENTKKALDKTTLEKSSMQFLGIDTSKTIYNLVVWSIIGSLTVILIIFVLRFKRSNHITKTSQQLLKSTELELEDLRRRSIEKEQKLGRQLQNERNKVARLKSD
jgi:preprotein translocase subunit SecF